MGNQEVLERYNQLSIREIETEAMKGVKAIQLNIPGVNHYNPRFGGLLIKRLGPLEKKYLGEETLNFWEQIKEIAEKQKRGEYENP